MCVKNLPNLASIVSRKKIVVRFDEIFLTQNGTGNKKKNEFWRKKNIEIGYFPNTSLLEKYTQLQHAKHVLCMLLQAGKWYNYYLFFWCSHFWHACHEFLRKYLCTTSFVCDIFLHYLYAQSDHIIILLQAKKISLKLYNQKMKNIKEKINPWSFLARIFKKFFTALLL